MQEQDMTEKFYEAMQEWFDESAKLANRKIDLMEAKRELRGAEDNIYETKTPKELGANEAARKAAIFIITYPQIKDVDTIQFDIYRLEVEVNYLKAIVNYQTALAGGNQ